MNTNSISRFNPVPILFQRSQPYQKLRSQFRNYAINAEEYCMGDLTVAILFVVIALSSGFSLFLDLETRSRQSEIPVNNNEAKYGKVILELEGGNDLNDQCILVSEGQAEISKCETLGGGDRK